MCSTTRCNICKMMSVNQVIYIFAYCFTVLSHIFCISTGCVTPVAEGHSYYIHFAPYIQYTYIAFRVDRGNGYEEITRCYTTGSCSTVNTNYVQFLTMSAWTQLYNTTLEMQSVNRGMANWTAVWTDIYGMFHITQPCNITTYVLPQLPNCDQPVFTRSNTAVSVTCRTQRVFPAAKCLFNNYSQISINPSVSYTYESLTENPGDVSMGCTVTWSLQPIAQQNVVIAFSVTMVQYNVILTPLDSISLELYTPAAELGNDCPKYVNASSTCTCMLTQTGSPPGHAVWSSSTGDPLVTVDSPDGSSKLILPERQSDMLFDTEYNCTARSAIGQQKDSLKYKPQYILPPMKPTCDPPSFNVSNTAVTVTCRTDRVYPSAQCRFIPYEGMTNLTVTLLYNRNFTSPINSQDYKTECSFYYYISTKLTQPTVSRFAVGMYVVNQSTEVISDILALALSSPESQLDSDCPTDYIESSTIATCTCKLTNAGVPPGEAYWTSTNTEKLSTISKNGSSQLEVAFSPSVLNVTYYCRSKSAVLELNNAIMFKPKFAYILGDVSVVASSSSVQFMVSTSVLITCTIPTNQVAPGVLIYIVLPPGNKTLITSIQNDGSCYTAKFTYVFSHPGLFILKCEAHNSKFPTIISYDTVKLESFGGVGSVMFDNTLTRVYDVCLATIPVECTVTVSQVYPGTIRQLFINDQLKYLQQSNESDATYLLIYNIPVSRSGTFSVTCTVVNTQTREVMSTDSITLTVTDATCGESSNPVAMAAGLASAIPLVTALVIAIVCWKCRQNARNKDSKRTVRERNERLEAAGYAIFNEAYPHYVDATENPQYNTSDTDPSSSTDTTINGNGRHIYDEPFNGSITILH